MTDAELHASLDEVRAMSLAILETLSEKSLPGSWTPIFSKQDVEKALAKQIKIMDRLQKEREERARGLVLPPGVSR